MKQFGVIDLGTNTFHLLIVEQQDDGNITELFRERIFVKLAEEGISYIGAAPFERGLNAIKQFKSTLDQHNISVVKAFGTAALRTASNATEFITQIKQHTGISVDIIDGKEEARLIYKGVARATSFDDHNELIMDIGGGSVEFIVANKNGVLWSESFPIGVAVLTQQFHKEDPLPTAAIRSLMEFLDITLLPLRKIMAQFPIKRLIGASGTFDVLEVIFLNKSNNSSSATFPVSLYFPVYKKLISSSLSERLNMASIPASRAEMIVTALILIQYVLEISKASHITVVAFAMKEGMLAEIIDAR